jgi:hypothetical protein
MRSLITTPLESTLAGWWSRIDDACKKAFFVTLCVNLLAFGFEMTNLTLHHDDVNHILIESTILGHYLGRFGHGWLHYYTQNHYVMPFLQMLEGMLMMSAYAVLTARFWGARRATDIAVLSAIICTFPYMANVFQYNTTQAAYPAAHLLVVLALMLSVRATMVPVAIASLFYVAAFSIYQAVASNAATIFVVWLLSRHLFGASDERLLAPKTVRATIAVLASVLVGGTLYLAAVSMMNLEPDTIHASEEAFQLRGALSPMTGIVEMVQGTRSFFRWPEAYFPDYLKALQLAALAAAAFFCFRLPGRIGGKFMAGALLALAIFAPRVLQILAPKGQFHSLTLTAYALVIAAAVMVVMRAGRTVTRNLSLILSICLIGGYVLQCNWISTVNYLNMFSHLTTLSQVLARVRSIPDAQWDGTKIAVVGTYDMPRTYPYAPATGVAPTFMDAKHMTMMARLLRDEAVFVSADASTPKILEYAATHPAWPAPGSVGVVDGTGVVVFSKTPARVR